MSNFVYDGFNRGDCMSFKSKLNKIWPSFAYIPSLFVLAYNTFVYTCSKAVNINLEHYELTTCLDTQIPFVSWFIIFYVLAFAQWVWNYFFHARSGRENFYHIIVTDIIAKTICLVFFLALPTRIVRPEIVGNNFFDNFVKLIYFLDTPTNLFPSVHCLASWLCCRAAFSMKKASWWYKWLQLILTLLVFASTVLIKQHFLADIVAGVLAVELGWFLSKRFSLWRVVKILETPKIRQQFENI